MIYKKIKNIIYKYLVDADKIKGVEVDDTDKADTKVLAYNSTSDKLEYEDSGGAGSGEYKLGIGEELIGDDDEDSGLIWSSDDVFELHCGGLARLGITNSGTYLYSAYIFITNQLRCAKEIRLAQTAKPTAENNVGFVYSKDISDSAEVMALDESDTETQLTSHDKDGYYIHKSTIPKRKLKLQIDIERFFRKHYPEFVNAENLELNTKQKYIRTKHLIKKNLLRLTIVGLIALEVVRLINLWG